MDIETAPKDGTRLRLAPFVGGQESGVGYWTNLYGGCWYAKGIGHLNGKWKPTRWKPSQPSAGEPLK